MSSCWMVKDNMKRGGSVIEKTYTRYAKYINANLKLLQGKILEMELWTVTGKRTKSFPFPPMAIHGLCCATNIRKYDCKFFFLTFKCYCFHQTSCVAVHSSSGHVWQMAEERCLGGLLFFGPHHAASWTNHKRINNWVSHPKHWGVGSLKILWLVIMFPLPPPEQPNTHPPVVSLIASRKCCDMEPSLRSFVCP